MIKIINTDTRQILEIDESEIKLFCKRKEYKESYGIPENIVLPVPESVILSEMQKTGNWIKFSDYNDWLHSEYNFRVSGGLAQYKSIGRQKPDFLVVLKQGTPNPVEDFGDNWEVYINNFVPPTVETQKWLISIGCTIEKNPAKPELILEYENEVNILLQ